MTAFVPPQARAAWQALQNSANQPLPHLRELLADGTRADRMQLTAADLHLDFSRQRITPLVWSQLLDLAAESDVLGQAKAMARGDAINATEGRAVLHVALRGGGVPNPPWGATIGAQVEAVLTRMLAFADTLYSGQAKGHSGRAITDVVNLGIGGSDLGPRMAHQALLANASTQVSVHFVSNPDAWALHDTLRHLDPATTLVVVSSKTFTTQETLTLANSARRWLLDGGVPEAALGAHLAAVSAAVEKATAFGVRPENIFGFWDWVGGRYSVWSAIGLPLAIAIGSQAFREFLAGAQAMDAHFLNAQPDQNMPLTLALLGIWNRNFLNCPTHLISPYAWRLERFASFIQQMDMESNGKSTRVDGAPVDVASGPIVWGGLGIDGQHAYFQLLHQGQHTVPVDFIGVKTEDTPTAQLPLAPEHHRVVMLNLNAQAQALACGRDAAATADSLRAAGMSDADVQRLTPHRQFPGNVPSNVLWMAALTPRHLGALIALYEHKVFCQAAIWGVHAFDQWGVELGKTMAKAMESTP